MIVVDGYTSDSKEMTTKTHPKLVGKSFNSFSSIINLLNPGETVTTEHLGKGYKQVGKDSKTHCGWIQHNFVNEY